MDNNGCAAVYDGARPRRVVRMVGNIVLYNIGLNLISLLRAIPMHFLFRRDYRSLNLLEMPLAFQWVIQRLLDILR